jgi:hypothetical protein
MAAENRWLASDNRRFSDIKEIGASIALACAWSEASP